MNVKRAQKKSDVEDEEEDIAKESQRREGERGREGTTSGRILFLSLENQACQRTNMLFSGFFYTSQSRS